MRQLVSILFTSLLVFPAWAGEKAAEVQPVLVCHELLDQKKIQIVRNCPTEYCQYVHGLFKTGRDRESKAVGYLGISQPEMAQLLEKGYVEPTRWGWTVMLTSADPAARTRAPEINLRLDMEDQNRDKAFLDASSAATTTEVLELIMGRLESRTGKPPVRDEFLESILVDIYFRFERLSISRGLKLIFNDFLDAVEEQNIPITPAKYRSQYMSLESSIRRNMGNDIGLIENYQKLIALMQWMGLPTDEIGNPKSEDRRELLRVFESLPKKDGYVLLVNKNVLPRLTSGARGLADNKLVFADIVGIEPVSDRAFRFLNSLGN